MMWVRKRQEREIQTNCSAEQIGSIVGLVIEWGDERIIAYEATEDKS